MRIDWTDETPVFFDFETQSAADLKAIGSRRYAAHASTRVLSLTTCFRDIYYVWIPSYINASSVDTRGLWLPSWGERPEIRLFNTKEFPEEMKQPNHTHIAHNCFGFDRFIWGRFCPYEPAFADTIPVARSRGLQGSLDAIAKATGIGGKDAAKKLMPKLCYAEDTPTGTRYPGILAGDLEAFTRYNVGDVCLLKKQWEMFSDAPVEADVIESHFRVNDRGIKVDASLLRKIASMGRECAARAADEISRLTATKQHPEGVINGSNLNSGKQVQAWMKTQGVIIRDSKGKETLRKDEVDKALAMAVILNPSEEEEDYTESYLDVLPEKGSSKQIPQLVVDVLQRRSAAIRITGAKAAKALERMCPDGRIRDLLTYHMAGTGRSSSQGVQIHNLPRVKAGIEAYDFLALHEYGVWDNDARECYDLLHKMIDRTPRDKLTQAELDRLTVDDVLAAMIRPSIMAENGSLLVISDFSGIEARVLAWLAGEEWLQEVFRTGKDVYKVMAAKVFNVRYEDVTETQRQIGKIIILACGYGMGAEKFALFCSLAKVDLEAAGLTPVKCIEDYRDLHTAIAGKYAGSSHGYTYRRGGIWHRYNDAFKRALAGECVTEGKCTFYRQGANTIIQLPSTRELVYRNARIEPRVPAYEKSGNTKPTIVYDSVRGEATLYGGKITENIDQAISRDLMVYARVRYEQRGGTPIADVHDEIIAEVPERHAVQSLRVLVDTMQTLPPWGEGLVIDCEAFFSQRYTKKPEKRMKKWVALETAKH